MPIPYFKDLKIEAITQSIVILDIDGTLLADSETVVDDVTAVVVKKLSAQGNMVYLVSNGFSHKKERNLAIAKQLDVTFYASGYKKPLKLAVAPLVAGATKPVIIIGDKFLTDGLLAVNLGVPFVTVRSLRSAADPLYSKIAYALDRLVKKFFSAWARPPFYAAALYGFTAAEPLTILTQPPKTFQNIWSVALESIKIAVKDLLFAVTKKPRYLTAGGPRAVIRSLLTGLDELKVAYRFNPWQHQATSTACVIRGVDTLRWALDQKQKGFIKTIVAGPNIVVTPADENRLIMDVQINHVVVPSQWNKDWWVSFDQSLEHRITPWAAGVSDNGPGRDPKGLCLVYSKNVDEKLFSRIIESLWEHKVPITVSAYGQFHQHEYFRLLKKTRMLIYLSNFESQGLALHEAWMADIPTLVFSGGQMRYNEHHWENPLISAPYFDPRCGLIFTSEADFESKLLEFIEKYDTFTPRNYSLEHFTDAIAARRYLDVVESAQKQ